MRQIALLCSLWLAAGASPLLAQQPPGGQENLAKTATEAEKKGEAASKAKPKEEAKPAAAAQRARAMQMQRLGYYVPEEADPNDATERMLIALPGGPLLIELEITLDGLPFRTSREALVRQMLALADSDGNGVPTWDEALQSARFLGRYASYNRTEAMQANFRRQFDRDEDGNVTPAEVRWFLSSLGGGPTFHYNPRYAVVAGGATNGVEKLLDTDNSGSLSAQELATAGARLKGRDANDNDILDLAELNGAANRLLRASGGGRVEDADLFAFHLHAAAEWDLIHQALLARYGRAKRLATDACPLSAQLFQQLDDDRNGGVDLEELPKLLSATPHLELLVRLGDGDQYPEEFQLKASSAELASHAKLEQVSPKTLSLQLPGWKLELLTGGVTNNYLASIESQAKTQFAQFDKDKNGYLELTEFAGQRRANFKTQFMQWDLDEDGKVYEDELRKALAAGYQVQWQRVSVAAARQPNSLISRLDINSDGQLGIREMQAAGRELASLDANHDGQVSKEEIPDTYRLAVARASLALTLLGNSGRVSPQRPAAATENAGPEWFVRMDRNGDGDISPREFLGDAEQFRLLDANQDGFVERKEATAGSE